jgi:hypothetical protein
VRHFGIELGKTIEDTMRETLPEIGTKLQKRRILATTPPTDILHSATLINPVMIPLYNPILMALPATEENLVSLHKEILSLLWKQAVDSETIQKRCLVASK